MAPQATAAASPSSNAGTAAASTARAAATTTNANPNAATSASRPSSAAAGAQSSQAQVAAAASASQQRPSGASSSQVAAAVSAQVAGSSAGAQTSSTLPGSLGVSASSAEEHSAATETTPTSRVILPSLTYSNDKAPQHKGLSSGAIGGIVGGAVGGLAFAVIVFFLWRTCRGRGEKLPPPPPRPEMQSLPRPVYGSRGGSHSRNSSVGPHRASSYSTLLAASRNAPTYQPNQYYSSYPAASTPSSFTPENSPRFGGSLYPSGSPSLSSNGTGANTPSAGTALGPGDSSVRDAASTTDSSGGVEERELHHQGSHSQLSAAGDMRPATPPSERSTQQGSGSGSGSGLDSRATSRPPSTVNLPSQRSMSNLSQGVYGRFAVPRTPSGGVPHARSSMMLTMPRPLSEQSLSGSGADGSPTPTIVMYSPRSSLAGRPLRNSYQSARSYSEFGPGTSSAPRSPTIPNHPRSGSGTFMPDRATGTVFVESPIDTETPSFVVNGSTSSRRQDHGIV